MKKYNQMLYHPDNCLNKKKPYPRECRLCIEACPHKSIGDKKEISIESCTECGVCMAVCPSDGFVDRDMKNLGEYLLENGNCVLNCPMAAPAGYEIACLGMLDRDAWTVLMLLAESKQVRILTGDCSNCQDKQAAAVSQRFYLEVSQQWMDHPGLKLEILPAEEGAAESDYGPGRFARGRSKKGLKNRLREFGKDRIKAAFPAIEAEESYTIPRTRQWLAETLKQKPNKKVPFQAIRYTDQCNGCGVCTKICPQQALTLKQKENKMLLIYEPLQCVQCGRCVDICGSRALSFAYLMFPFKFLAGKVIVGEANSYYCRECGKQIFIDTDSGLCAACAAHSTNIEGR